MPTSITLIGNEGFRIAHAGAAVLVDAFIGPMPGVFRRRLGVGASAKPVEAGPADLILVTHSHWDHFNADAVARAARETAAAVIGPSSVTGELKGQVPPEKLVELEPPLSAGKAPFASRTVELPAATITAWRTHHSRDHNSYLVEMPGFRFFHDGDNEDTRRFDLSALGKLDALLIGPWQGAGWVEFVERLAPRRWFLMHLSDEELRQHAEGKFLPDLCDRVPPGLVVLKPGETFVFD